MLTCKQNQSAKILSIFVFFISFLCFCTIHAQNKIEKVVSINCTLFPNNSDLNYKVAKLFAENLKEEGYNISSKAKLDLLLTTKELAGRNEIIVNIVYMIGLPDEMLAYNIKNETFFEKVKNKKDLPKEGKFVREMVTEEILQNYKMPIEFDTVIISKDDFENGIKKMDEMVINKIARLNSQK